MLIDAALNPAEIALLPQRDLSDTACVVFDILRATSSMITALAHGVAAIHPVLTLEDAFELKKSIPHAKLGGERHGERPEGFDFGNSPLEYCDSRGAEVIWTTTNGTFALKACERAMRTMVGSLLNLKALETSLVEGGYARVLLVCAGTQETLALEDVLAAGCLAAALPKAELTDAAKMARALAASYPDPLTALREARNGRALLAKGRDAELEWCARQSVYNIGAFMDGSVVRPIT